MTEGEDLRALGRPNGVEVIAEAEDVGTLVGAERVVDDELPGDVMTSQEGEYVVEPEVAQLVEVPASAGEDAMEGGVLPETSGAADDEAFGQRVTLLAEQPGGHDEKPASEGGRAKSRAEDFQRTQKRASSVLGQGASL